MGILQVLTLAQHVGCYEYSRLFLFGILLAVAERREMLHYVRRVIASSRGIVDMCEASSLELPIYVGCRVGVLCEYQHLVLSVLVFQQFFQGI